MRVARIATGAALLVLTTCSTPDSSDLFARARDGTQGDGAGPAPAAGGQSSAAPELQSPNAPTATPLGPGGEGLAGIPALLPSPSGPGASAPGESPADAGAQGATLPAASPETRDPDAGEPPAPPDSQASCAGLRFGDGCWYLGNVGQSCERVCAPHDGFSAAALPTVGTASQGGSSAACARVLDALGVTLSVTTGVRNDGAGLGCHLFIGSDGELGAWWLAAPDFAVDAASVRSRLACGCAR
jgi:hypothetical protein